MLINKIKKIIHKYEKLESGVLLFWCLLRIAKAKMIFGRIKHNEKNIKFKVIIPAIRAFPSTDLVFFDALFGHAFKRLGCQVKMVYCGGFLDSCDADTVFKNQKPQCFNCKLFGELTRKALGLDYVCFNKYISKKEIEEIKKIIEGLGPEQTLNYNYLGINIGRHAHSSSVRYFLFGRLNLNNEKEVQMLRKKLFYGMVITRVAARIIDEEKPDVVFTLHGNYSTWGPFFSYARARGIDTVINSHMPPRFGCFLFNRNTVANTLASAEKWLLFKNRPLKYGEKERTERYFNERYNGQSNDQKNLYNKQIKKSANKEEFLRKIFENNYKRQYVMYPNLAWDATIEGSISKLFFDVFEWVDKTIEFFKGRKDYQLIIRTHPGEGIWDQCSKGMAKYIEEKHSPLPENIVVLKPDVPIVAYDLIKENSVAIIFNGTLGMELALKGVPLLIGADSVHYKEAGLVYDIKSVKDYLDLLENPEKAIKLAKENRELAKKYADFYLFKALIRIPFYSKSKWGVIEWDKLKDLEKILSDKSNVIKICQKIINKEDIIFDYGEVNQD